ncbi:MAG: hypothetical protein SPL31_04760 [Succinivibrio sp.]|nr:hypothetical protein [Succinivibrio sp.]
MLFYEDKGDFYAISLRQLRQIYFDKVNLIWIRDFEIEGMFAESELIKDD